MTKQVGFRRDIRGAWFDTVAALRTETADVDEIRTRLDELLAADIVGEVNRAITVQVLLRIWANPNPQILKLHQEAVKRFSAIEAPSDRVWLHYGLCLVTYPFFRDAVDQAGQLLRQRGVVSAGAFKERVIAEIGQLGSLDNAITAVMFALRSGPLSQQPTSVGLIDLDESPRRLTRVSKPGSLPARCVRTLPTRSPSVNSLAGPPFSRSASRYQWTDFFGSQAWNSSGRAGTSTSCASSPSNNRE